MSETKSFFDACLAQAIKDHESHMLGYVKSLLKGDVATSEEVVMFAFAQLYKQIAENKADKIRNLRSWLLTVCRNRVAELARSGRIAQTYDPSTWDTMDESPNACELQQNQEDQERLATCMDKLSPAQREIVRLKIWEKLKYDEIAEILEITANNAGVRMHNALRDLRKCFGK